MATKNEDDNGPIVLEELSRNSDDDGVNSLLDGPEFSESLEQEAPNPPMDQEEDSAPSSGPNKGAVACLWGYRFVKEIVICALCFVGLGLFIALAEVDWKSVPQSAQAYFEGLSGNDDSSSQSSAEAEPEKTPVPVVAQTDEAPPKPAKAEPKETPAPVAAQTDETPPKPAKAEPEKTPTPVAAKTAKNTPQKAPLKPGKKSPTTTVSTSIPPIPRVSPPKSPAADVRKVSPPTYAKPVADRPRVDPITLTFDGMMGWRGNYTASINGRWLKVGQKIQGAKLLDVGPMYAYVEWQGRRFRLKMGRETVLRDGEGQYRK